MVATLPPDLGFFESEMNLLLVNYNVALFSALEWVHVLHTLGWILEKLKSEVNRNF